MSANFVGHTALDYVDEETGEVTPGYWVPMPERRYYKHEPNILIDSLMKSSDKAMNVLGYLLSHMVVETNQVKASYRQVARDMNFADSTVITCFSTLQEWDDIRLVQRGLWMINPRLHSKGYEKKTLQQMAVYDRLETLAERRTKKKEKETNKDDRLIQASDDVGRRLPETTEGDSLCALPCK